MDQDSVAAGFTVLFLFGLVFLLGTSIGGCYTKDSWQKAAIENNAAHWEVSKEGHTKLVWGAEK
jgi:hypothetical protein